MTCDAIVLCSGGLDSSVVLATALQRTPRCLAMAFDYGQRHRVELNSAAEICSHYNVPLKIIPIDRTGLAGASLVYDGTVPKGEKASEGVPNTFVPARNTLFLSYALGQADLFCAKEIYFGSNADDYNCYLDCRPEYIQAFQNVINLTSRQGPEGAPPKLVTPLLHLTKKEIVEKAIALNVPLDLTWTCYDPVYQAGNVTPCETCLACQQREAGFRAAGIEDPLLLPSSG